MDRQKIAQETFERAINLLEKKLNVTIKTAVLTFKTPFQTIEIIKGKSETVALMQITQARNMMVQLIQENTRENDLIECRDCEGRGEQILDGGTLYTCPTCKGGGELIK